MLRQLEFRFQAAEINLTGRECTVQFRKIIVEPLPGEIGDQMEVQLVEMLVCGKVFELCKTHAFAEIYIGNAALPEQISRE